MGINRKTPCVEILLEDDFYHEMFVLWNCWFCSQKNVCLFVSVIFYRFKTMGCIIIFHQHLGNIFVIFAQSPNSRKSNLERFLTFDPPHGSRKETSDVSTLV